KMKNAVQTAICELLEAVGIDNTTTHTEIKIAKDEIYLIELNARSGGDHIAYPLTELSTGYPYIQGAINIALDSFLMPKSESFDENNCGILFISKQTQDLKAIFDECENYTWLYKKIKLPMIWLKS
ncbi:MAG: hypothetical protein ACRC5H_10015, partial [Treponemataceae bacterium]